MAGQKRVHGGRQRAASAGDGWEEACRAGFAERRGDHGRAELCEAAQPLGGTLPAWPECGL